MTNDNKYDPMGELFRQKMESHLLPVDSSSWDEIESRLDKSNNKAIIWLWRSGAVAAAAAVAALLLVSRPTIDEAAVSQQIISYENTNNEVSPTIAEQKISDAMQIDIAKPVNKTINSAADVALAVFQTMNTDTEEHIALLKPDEIENIEIAIAEQSEIFIAEAEQDKEIAKLSPLFWEDESVAKKNRKWLLAAALGTSGGQSENPANQPSSAQMSNQSVFINSVASKSSGNQYAAELSGSVQSFNYLDRNDFTEINHLPPLSFGIMAQSLGEDAGVEFGLIYTFLSSQFEWQNTKAYQKLYYIGIPVNLVIYLWNSNPDWRIYLSGGVTAEKGLRAIYQQEENWGSTIRNTHVKSSIDGVQWSANGALGVNYRFEKCLGIYFESRFGHSFDNNQPISIRTERPFFIGLAMGLSYQL